MTALALILAGVLVCGVGLYRSLTDGVTPMAVLFTLLLAVLAWELYRPWRSR